MASSIFSACKRFLYGSCRFRLRVVLCLLFVVVILIASIRRFTSSDDSFPDFEDVVGEPLTLTIEVVGSDIDGAVNMSGRRSNTLPEASCRLPHLEINASEVIGFFKDPAPLACDTTENWAYIDQNGKFALIKGKKDANCTGQPFVHKDDSTTSFLEVVTLATGASLPSDYVKVKCTLGWSSWDGYLMSVVPNPHRVNKLKSIRQSATWSGLSVYMLGFDSLSQLSFRRKLPKTVKFLEETMGSVVLNGYNIVGDGTPQAFIPILTAQTEVELPMTRKRFDNAHYVDDVYPFAWKNFSNAGYATMFAEDTAFTGMFSYRLKGFRHQPTDHYTRTFFNEAEKRSGPSQCLGSEPLHKEWLRYSREFMSVYKDIPRFLMMHHGTLSHDHLNMVSVMDDDFVAHLRSMYESGEFENVLVIVFSDHGHRFAELRETHQGQLEERLPFFSVALPKTFIETERGREVYENLLTNKDRLSTPFDIHTTLMDILRMPPDLSVQNNGRSMSLFRPIPVNRTCQAAGIEPHWCTCLDWQNASTNARERQEVAMLADGIVSAINRQTEHERKLCALLRVKEVLEAKKLIPNNDLMKFKQSKDIDGVQPDFSAHRKVHFAHYQVKLMTMPGGAIYEATVFYTRGQSLVVDLTAISHVNPYGDLPHCIIDTNYFLAAYCVCYDKIPPTASTNRTLSGNYTLL